MESTTNQYMVDFTLPDNLTDDFISTLPNQKRALHRLFLQGKLLNYALSIESSKLWAVFSAATEADLMEMVCDLPLSKYMRIRVSELAVYDANARFQHAFSAN